MSLNNTITYDLFNNNDFIFNNDISNNIISGGYNINSIFLKGGFSPIKTFNNYNFDINNSNNVGDLFSNLVIPNWLYKSSNSIDNYDNIINSNDYIKGGNRNRENSKNKNIEDVEDVEIIDEDLHNKLLNLVKHYNPREKISIKKTKKNKKSINKKSHTKRKI